MQRQYTKFLAGSGDHFDPSDYSSVNDEIRGINEMTAAVPVDFKMEIIISFLKDHSLQNNWIEGNPALTELITSQAVFTGSIESLFESSRNNPAFRQSLEVYLKEKFMEPVQR